VFSLITGLSAEKHGIVGNYMYDRETGLEFSLSTTPLPSDNTANPMWWTKHKPLWISATEQGSIRDNVDILNFKIHENLLHNSIKFMLDFRPTLLAIQMESM